MRRTGLVAAGLLAACQAAGPGSCRSRETPTGTATPRPTVAAPTGMPTGTYRPHPVSNGRAIEVHLTYAGQPRAPWPLPAAFDHCGGASAVADPSLAIGARHGVDGAVVWLDDIHDGEPAAVAEATEDQKGCAFLPHVIAVTAGARLRLTNSDPANHTVRVVVGGESILRMIPPGGAQAITTEPAWAGQAARITCPIHPWMLGWLHVFEHPYFAVTTDGVARLERVPPGTWHLVVWHEAIDARLTEAGVTQGAPTRASFEVTVGDRDVARSFSLQEDGSIR